MENALLVDQEHCLEIHKLLFKIEKNASVAYVPNPQKLKFYF